MKRKVKIGIGILLALMCTLCACKSAPEKEAVISKNDGAFDKIVVQSADIVPEEDQIKNIHYQENFSSTDGSVFYRVNIDQKLELRNHPVVKVVPHYLTGEDAKRVASTLLSDTTFYEEEPILMPDYSKAQIQEKISRWTEYSNEEAIRTLYGNDIDAEYTLDIVKKFIKKYTDLLTTAEDKELVPCGWNPEKASYFYAADSEELEALKGKKLEDDNDEIHAVAKKNGVEYNLVMSVRNQKD